MEMDISKYSVKELRQLCRDYGIENYSRMKKTELSEILSQLMSNETETANRTVKYSYKPHHSPLYQPLYEVTAVYEENHHDGYCSGNECEYNSRIMKYRIFENSASDDGELITLYNVIYKMLSSMKKYEKYNIISVENNSVFETGCYGRIHAGSYYCDDGRVNTRLNYMDIDPLEKHTFRMKIIDIVYLGWERRQYACIGLVITPCSPH
jgi:hypothetical protein